MIHTILTLPLILAVLVPIVGILYPLMLMVIVSQKTEEVKVEN